MIDGDDFWRYAVCVRTADAMNQKETAEYLGVSAITLKRSRERGDGPPYAMINGRAIYSKAAVDAWLAGQTMTGSGS